MPSLASATYSYSLRIHIPVEADNQVWGCILGELVYFGVLSKKTRTQIYLGK